MKNFIYIETYGCTANQNNSEILAGILTNSGYQITNNPQIADIIIINTCIVKGKTENKIKRRIQDLSNLYPDKLTIIAGCMPETDAKQIKQLNPKAILLGTHHFKQIVNLINSFNKNLLTSKIQDSYLEKRDEEKVFLPKIPRNKLISICQISEGCLGNCTYCKTRLAKHQLYSYDFEKIINSIQSDLKNGAKEVWLTSQDCAAYGIDKFGKSKLPELLDKILNLKHKFKLRLGMMNPNHLLPIQDKILKLYHSKKIYKFLHLPIQSASDKVLKEMSRYYNIDDVKLIINKFKSEIPDLTFSTDVIVGYPIETKQDHQKNLEFIKNFQPDVLNLSKFSKHKGTGAEKLKELNISIIKKRTSQLMKTFRQLTQKNKKKYLGKKIPVFLNEKSKIPGFLEGRDDNYNIILVEGDKSLLSKSVTVKISQIGVYHMLGEVVV